MFKKRFYYLIRIQYLGYRFHGWQKQPKLKTVHFMIDRTLNYILEGKEFKSLGSGRTDAMVSANESAFELFVYEEIEDESVFLELFNKNLPQDIRALAIEEVDANFNIIQDSKIKEYVYLFTYAEKCHPFCASLMTTFLDDLDIELMKTGAKLFEGTHNFKPYCFRATDEGLYEREVLHCELSENSLFTANFFPKKSYTLIVRGKGFGRNQIRLMMGTLVNLGRGDVTLEYIENSLKTDSTLKMEFIAPASGLILNKVAFE
ncbi:tRNA pseudouridine synthase A [Subsaximicrobium wynnwilliamsii]|jgi:tRNA pseudouridine38-40 synthase|uniref:tRNA pseudouridine synthase A n=1 Tax=Subsaximicrobium wynnwilliamsii TaxID=291179 RepID=A0A5C6ZHW9_9FLAO|nr:tRNA pseudouridine synthase A [Subsaximicrobium wynnwilliamsii]TXD84126.1 tRNA pseudouridine synthase A [Subsaximicrobium wynnwilliamsii]TXD88916.1 tRNA pseudouridine synthase A [Subsaximicrobium wynnwilliamsii]TXE03838.1 tRNA pseudouridine synthase A [Subsaximicrobium wynnwilliamsii]